MESDLLELQKILETQIVSECEIQIILLTRFDHPRFGQIKCIKTIKRVSPDDELTVAYGYDHSKLDTEAPTWYKTKLKTFQVYTYFGPRVYPKGSLVIAHVRVSIRVSIRVCVRPSLNISETVHCFFLFLDTLFIRWGPQ